MGDDEAVWLEKICPVHGIKREIISTEPEHYAASSGYNKPTVLPKGRFSQKFIGCPYSCGLCPKHQQHTCLAIAEITSLCDLNCPICLKIKGDEFGLSPEDFAECLNKLSEYEGGLILVNLSGGEPTLHPRFADFLKVAAELGVAQLTVSTNGLRLSKDKALRELFVNYSTVAALQFDGLSENTYLTLRGRKLLSTKLETIEIFEKEGLPYSLTAVVAKGVNDWEIGAIADFFFNSKALSLMIQPAAVVGEAYRNFGPQIRPALDEVVKALETSKNVAPGDMTPIACSHPSCAASAYYFNAGEGRFLSLKKFLGLEQYLEVTANRAFPGLDLEGSQIIRDKIYQRWAAASSDPEDIEILERARGFLRRLEGREFTPGEAFDLGKEMVKSVFVHAFMDPYCLDLARLSKCCNHYLRKGGQLIPMCAHNFKVYVEKAASVY
jgi:uncharacterized radical SAM superfamily Fe-S cluster-containing enzyme